MVILSPCIIFYLKEKKTDLCEKEKKELNDQFKEAIMIISGNLQAGYSIENAFSESYRDLMVMFGKGSIIVREWECIIRGLKNNIILEYLLFDLAKRSRIDNIRDFAEIFQIAKRNGGDLNHIIHATVNMICEKTQIYKEIQTLLSAKIMEQKIMLGIPIFIILYIKSSSPGFFEPLYHNITGIIIMTACLIVYVVAYVMAKRIMKIEL